MKKLLLLSVILLSLASCEDTALEKCINQKVKEGMTTSEARSECRGLREDARVRR